MILVHTCSPAPKGAWAALLEGAEGLGSCRGVMKGGAEWVTCRSVNCMAAGGLVLAGWEVWGAMVMLVLGLTSAMVRAMACWMAAGGR